MYQITVIKAWSSGESVPVTVGPGSTVGAAASQVGAPSGAKYTLNGSLAKAETAVGNGDTLVISLGKVDAGC